MKKIVCLLLLFVCAFSFAQTPTPNIGLQIPATGSNNWYIPLNYNFSKLDQLLSGNLPLPALSVTNDVHIGGNLYANQFIGPSGSSFATATGAQQYSPAYYCGAGTSSAFCGVAPFNGLISYRTNGAPQPATIANVLALWVGGGCTGTNYLRADGTCQSALPAGVTSINGTPGAFTFSGAGVTCTTTSCVFTGGGALPNITGLVQANGLSPATAATTAQVNAAIGSSNGLVVLGDSIAASTGTSSTGVGNIGLNNGYAYKMRDPIGGLFLLGANPGDQVADNNYKWNFRVVNPMGSGIDPVYVSELGTNDATVYAGNADKQKIFQRLMLGQLVNLSVPAANKKFAQTCTAAGGFAADAATPFSGMGSISTTNGATLTCSVVSPKASDAIYIVYQIIDSNTGTFTVTVDGTPQTDPISGTTTFSNFGDNGATILTQNNINTAYAAVRLTGFSAATHSVVITVTSATGATAKVPIEYVAFAPIADAVNNPLVYAVSPNQQNGTTGAPFVATYQGFISTITSQLTTDGLNVSYADTSNALLNSPTCGNGSAATMFATCYADTIHPNNTGHGLMAMTILAPIPVARQTGITTTWNRNQRLQNWIASNTVGYGSYFNPAHFFDVNPNNILGTTTTWAPGIKFQGSNAQLIWMGYQLNTGLTIGIPLGGAMSFCPFGSGGVVPALPPTSASCNLVWSTTGKFDFFGGLTNINGLTIQGGQISGGTNLFWNIPGTMKWTSNLSGPYSTVVPTSVSTNNNSPIVYYRGGTWNDITHVGAFDGPGWQSVAVNPTPTGQRGQAYMTAICGPAVDCGFDLRSVTLTNHLGTSDSGNLNVIGTLSVNGVAVPAQPVFATTSSLGGSALVAGACATTTNTITGFGIGGSTRVIATPQGGGPGDGFYWQSYGSASNVITTKVCASISGTPTANTYYLEIHP